MVGLIVLVNIIVWFGIWCPIALCGLFGVSVTVAFLKMKVIFGQARGVIVWASFGLGSGLGAYFGNVPC